MGLPRASLTSDTIVAYMSPFIAGTPPASSSGRGRGTTNSSLFSLEETPCVPPSGLGEETSQTGLRARAVGRLFPAYPPLGG